MNDYRGETLIAILIRNVPVLLAVAMATLISTHAAAQETEGAEVSEQQSAPTKSVDGESKRSEKDKKKAADKQPTDLGDEIKIFDGKTLKNWTTVKKFDFEQHGKIEVRNGSIHLEEGRPATGIAVKTKIPKSNYEISFRARRVKGSDFFCGLTFPIKKEFCTLILGGWGGQIVGLSNIDSFNAAENNTTQVIDFKNGQWYKVRLRVTDEFIRVWIDGEQIIEVEANHHKFTIYWEQEPVRPLGIVTWYTHGELKDLKLHKVKVNAKKKSADSKEKNAK